MQPEGEPDFTGVLAGIAAAVDRLAPLPVLVKEVGFGLDAEDVRLLAGPAWRRSTWRAPAAPTGR